MIYFLTAQLDPRLDEFYADKKAGLSLCRDERMIYIYRDTEAASDEFGGVPLEDQKDRLSKKLVSKIGGVLGFAADSMEADISLTKD